MIATTHLITGATVGVLTPCPYAASLLAFVLHFLLDAIPHTDFKKPYNFKTATPVLVDLLLGINIILVFVFFPHHSEKWNLVLGAFFGLLPDLIEISLLSFRPYWKRKTLYSRIHQQFHWFERSQKKPPCLAVSLVYQTVIWAICIVILAAVLHA